MKYLVLVAALLVVPASALQQEGRTITLTEEEFAKCQEEGCGLIPKDAMMKMLQKAYDMGKAAKTCKDET